VGLVKAVSGVLRLVFQQRGQAHLVETQHSLDALVQEEGLATQAAPVQRHQLLVEVHRELVEVEPALHVLRLPQRHRARGVSCARGARGTKAKGRGNSRVSSETVTSAWFLFSFVPLIIFIAT